MSILGRCPDPQAEAVSPSLRKHAVCASSRALITLTSPSVYTSVFSNGPELLQGSDASSSLPPVPAWCLTHLWKELTDMASLDAL